MKVTFSTIVGLEEKREKKNYIMRKTIVRVCAQGPGIGDALWLTALAKNFRIQRPDDTLITITNHPSVFQNSEDCIGIRFDNGDPRYKGDDVHLQFDFRTHAIDGYCLQLGLTPPFIRRNFIYLTEAEKEFGRKKIHKSLRVIAVQSQAGPWTRNKDWIHERFEEVILHFRYKGFRFIQIGGSEDKRLNECVDFFGTIRETASIMAACKLFVGPISAGMHLASAVGVPAVIIFGGREDPKCISLENHNIVASRTECSPCWRVEPCGMGKKCMESITVENVIATMEFALSKAS